MKPFSRTLSVLLSLAAPLAARAGDPLSFNRDIRPILSHNCFACHGFDAKKRKAGLRLDIPESATAVRDGHAAIVPGDPDKSEVMRRLFSDDSDEVMPPPNSHRSLTANEKETIRRWIAQGAGYQAHWSFVKPEKPVPPPAPGVTNPIDAFLTDRLRREGLTPAPEASRETLIRRVTLDLTGLPPTPAEVDAFVADASPRAYEERVDDLLSRRSHGEHMARYWLDLARYADTHGMHLDNERSMWPYRDWVVKAFNENLPFDQFTRWQLAGDLLPSPTRDQRVASGFNRCNVTTGEGGSINEEWIYRYAVDRTSTAIEIWMGLTAGCAVCHDHKFDPISSKDYYSMYAFFHSAADPAMDGNKIDTPPILKLTTPEDEKRLAELSARIAEVDAKIAEAVAKIDYTDPATLSPPPAPKHTETVWFEDDFQPKGNYTAVGHPRKLVTKEQGPVFSGVAAVTRSGPGVTQDVLEGGIELTVPASGKIFAHCFLDPVNPPETVMIQFHTSGWNHRAVWGAEERIPWGKPKTAEKVLMGPLPEKGKWVRLEVDAARMGLKAGTKVTGYAFTQFNGTVTWDQLGVSSTVDPAKDPLWSWEVWKKQNQGKRNDQLPDDRRDLVRGKKPDEWSEPERKRIRDFWLANFYAGARGQMTPIEAEKTSLSREKEAIEKNTPITFVMADLPQARESFVMLRGAYDKPGEKVARGVPAFLPSLPPKPADRDYNRLDFAAWLVNGEHPLTARVAVNRFWQQFFGTGLVKTSMDFGSQGEPPSHPELLDWLAVTFMEDGWDVRKLVRRIVTSQAYRRDARTSPEGLRRDPENRLLARGARFRLDAEVLRDQALFLSGLLVDKPGGKAVKPYQPENIWEPVGFGGSNTRVYIQDKGEALYRRSLYTFLKRTAPPPFMSTFDAPNREQSCTVRGRTNTPLQALQLMNDIQHVEAARNFAQRMIKEGGSTPEDRIRWGWRTVTARFPDKDEAEIVRNAHFQHRKRYDSDKAAASQLISYGESKPDAALDPAELAAYTLTANLLFNLDETVVKN